MSENHEEISRSIGRLEGKVDSLLDQNKEQFRLLNDHQNAINGLEKREAALMGKISIVTVIIGGLWAIVISFGKQLVDKLFK